MTTTEETTLLLLLLLVLLQASYGIQCVCLSVWSKPDVIGYGPNRMIAT